MISLFTITKVSGSSNPDLQNGWTQQGDALDNGHQAVADLLLAAGATQQLSVALLEVDAASQQQQDQVRWQTN